MKRPTKQITADIRNNLRPILESFCEEEVDECTMLPDEYADLNEGHADVREAIERILSLLRELEEEN